MNLHKLLICWLIGHDSTVIKFRRTASGAVLLTKRCRRCKQVTEEKDT